MEFGFLEDLLIVFAIGGLVVYALGRVKVPAVVGLLIAGAVIGPHGLSLVGDVHHVEVLAEIGVVLLLFTIGLEFSMEHLTRIWKSIVIGGGGQVLLSAGVVFLLAWLSGRALGISLFFGFLAALSSTAIVLRILGDRAELHSPAGRVSLGILLFQDLCIVPFVLLTPFLAGHGDGASNLLVTLLKAVGVIVGVLLAARLLVPAILLRVVRTRSRELFLTLLLVLCLGTAWLTSLSGLSLALGAFLAGLAVSESEYSHQAMAEALPFRDAFGSLFFVSVGMLMDVSFLMHNLVLVGVVLTVLVGLKVVTTAVPALVLGSSMRVAITAGFSLAQVGEFAFVLCKSGVELGLLNQREYQVFLSGSVLSMIFTPFLHALGIHIARRFPERAPRDIAEESTAGLTDHVVIAGYGINGQNLARALAASSIPYVILEMNPESVRNGRRKGQPIQFGDCTRLAVLEGLGILEARLFVIAISDAASTRQAVSIARSANPGLYIIVRTRFVSEIEELTKLGANEVIPEEFETAVEIFSRVLHNFEVPRNVILDLVNSVRSGMYEMLRGARPMLHAAAEIGAFSGAEVMKLKVREGSPVCGHTLAELGVRAKTGAMVLAVRRDGTDYANPDAGFRIELGDELVMMGGESALDAALIMIDPKVTGA
jgi:monovalent cation:H+ antiporter-2, CPA2 family